MSRIARRFASLKAEGRGALITFVTAGDPDMASSQAILDGLPAAGADLIELGAPFSDPTADGPAIQLASRRARAAGGSFAQTLEMARKFRKRDQDTPLIIMGYYNPIYVRGPETAAKETAEAGVDGLIIVDLPPEESDELAPHLAAAGVDLIRLAAPTSDADRLKIITRGASGFLYFVSVLGVTGGKAADEGVLSGHVARLRQATDLPIAVGFGVKTPAEAANAARIGDAAVVGSALCQTIAHTLDDEGRAKPGLVEAVLDQTRALAQAVRSAGRNAA